MRPGVVFAGFLAVVASIAGVVWLLQGKTLPTTAATAKQAAAKASESKKDEIDLTPPSRPPFPKAVIEETEFNFGVISVGTEKKHEFVIRNEGEAPLKVVEGEKTCQCTVGELDNNEVPPGKSVTVTLTWTPAAETEEFDKGVEIKTNDPNRRSFQLRGKGIVVARFAVLPAGTWNMLDIRDDRETEFQGLVASGAAKFQVTSIEAENPALTGVAAPLTDEELEKHRYVAGYRIKLKIKPALPVGSFHIPLKIKTDLPTLAGDGTEQAEVIVTGNRRGPLRIIGKDWVEELSAIYLGSFNATEGRKVSLILFVQREPAEGLQFTEVKCDVPDLKVSLEPDTSNKGAKRYRLTFEYPAGSPPVACRETNAAVVKVRTNHPEAADVEFKLYFVAL